MKPIVRALMRANDELNDEEATVGGPSEAAVRVARDAVADASLREARGRSEIALRAAHDPANFEDPMDVSVRKGDLLNEIVDWLRHIDRLGEIPGAADGMPKRNPLWEAANAALCRFGGDRA
jgi:hypothetical protein